MRKMFCRDAFDNSLNLRQEIIKVGDFLGPKWHLPNGSMPFYRVQPTCPRNGFARIKSLKYGAV
jgi:hypothetical protein